MEREQDLRSYIKGYLVNRGFTTRENLPRWSVEGLPFDGVYAVGFGRGYLPTKDLITTGMFVWGVVEEEMGFAISDEEEYLNQRTMACLVSRGKSRGTGISGGDNVMMDRDTAIVFMQYDPTGGANEKRQALNNYLHELMHTYLLWKVSRLTSYEPFSRLPNNLHPLFDEGLATVFGQLIGNSSLLCPTAEADDELVLTRNLPIFFKDDSVFSRGFSMPPYHGGLVLPWEEFYRRGYSREYLQIIEGIASGKIDLLDPKLTARLNFRDLARTDFDRGQIDPFGKQDAAILLCYSVGAALIWSLIKERIELDMPPLDWVAGFIDKVQDAYSFEKPLTEGMSVGSGVDFWPIVERMFPTLTKERLNQTMITLLRDSTEYYARMRGVASPENYLAKYVEAYRRLGEMVTEETPVGEWKRFVEANPCLVDENHPAQLIKNVVSDIEAWHNQNLGELIRQDMEIRGGIK